MSQRCSGSRYQDVSHAPLRDGDVTMKRAIVMGVMRTCPATPAMPLETRHSHRGRGKASFSRLSSDEHRPLVKEVAHRMCVGAIKNFAAQAPEGDCYRIPTAMCNARVHDGSRLIVSNRFATRSIDRSAD